MYRWKIYRAIQNFYVKIRIWQEIFLKKFLKSPFEFYCKNASAYAFVVKIKISIEEEYMAKKCIFKVQKKNRILNFYRCIKIFFVFLTKIILFDNRLLPDIKKTAYAIARGTKRAGAHTLNSSIEDCFE